ncbi:MAG: zinc ribbon domain-containing protein [Lachnospiraceae bacterium]|nr:zinc ribbon domain-containing protein [Lachnospiraceae bacterium]
MKCNVCGTENADGLSVCYACGAPLIAPVQNQGFSEQVQSVAQETKPEQPQQPQPSPSQQPQFSQPQGMQNQYQQPQFSQPQGMQNQYQQPQFGQQGFQNQYQPNGFQQPQGMGQYNMPHKERKPLSKGAKIGIISGLAAVLLIGIFFIFIFPILTRAKLSGSYAYESSYGDYYYLFDDGVYIYYEVESSGDKYYYDIGTYTVKDDVVSLKAVDGDEETLKFDAKKNTILYYGSVYKSSDKKAELEVDISKEYIENLNDTVVSASNAALKDKDVYDEATSYGYYFIYDDDLKDPYWDFEKELAKQLNYSSSKELQFLLEEMDLAFDIDISSSGVVTVDIY